MFVLKHGVLLFHLCFDEIWWKIKVNFSDIWIFHLNQFFARNSTVHSDFQSIQPNLSYFIKHTLYSSFFFFVETILSIHVGWVPMIHLHEKMKVVQQSDFVSMSLFENRQAGIFFHTSIRQDHTSQDHFCSVINEFPVWNLESI